MRRIWILIVSVSVLGALASCGGPEGDALDTLPPISTTSTTTTTTTTPDSRRIFYEVQANDNLSAIARSYQVPLQAIRDLNGLTTDVLQVGQILEIPNDVRLDLTLPPVSSSPSSTDP